MNRACRMLAAIIAVTVAATAQAQETVFRAKGNGSGSLVIASVTDLVAIRPLLDGFLERFPDLEVTYRQMQSLELYRAAKDACGSGEPFADIVISSAIAEQVKLVNDGCAAQLTVALPSTHPQWAQWQNSLVGMTFEPAVIVYDREAFPSGDVPQNRFDLVDLLRQTERFEGKVGTYDIERSGVGYMFAFQDEYQASTWGRLLEGLGRNRVKLFPSSSDIIDRVADGRLAIGYNVLGSYAMARQEADPRIGIVFPEDYTIVLSRAAFIPENALNAVAANALIEFSVSPEGQKLLAGSARLFSPGAGPGLLSAYLRERGIAFNAEALRPIAFSPRLLASLDRVKLRIFLEQWNKSVNPDAQ